LQCLCANALKSGLFCENGYDDFEKLESHFMRLSQYFLPTLKEVPTEAQITSHRLMLRAGMIQQIASGIYTWLPLGLRVLQNVADIIRQEFNQTGALEIIAPTIQPTDIWRESGRDNAYGEETLRMQDRHKRDYLYAPTAEEMVTLIARDYLKSYRDLPKTFYQIHWKFRDEIRPRFGVMRGREFLMKDGYSIDLSEDDAKQSYLKVMHSYIKIFRKMGLTAVPVKADTGPIGGDLSHEFHIVAQTGESGLYYDKRLTDLMQAPHDQVDVDAIMNIYAASDDLHNPDTYHGDTSLLEYARGIEVGHIFYLGTKYTEVLKATITDASGNQIAPHMGCYGIGVSRLVGAIIEACHDDKGIVWPVNVAPYKVGIININNDNTDTQQICGHIYQMLTQQNISVLYDDRDLRGGAKFADMDLIGLPWQIRVGQKGVAKGIVEVVNRKSGDMQELSADQAISFLNTALN